jgi:hypothetical protein
VHEEVVRSVEAKPSVQESLGIFQLIDQIETAVDKLLERQVAYNTFNFLQLHSIFVMPYNYYFTQINMKPFAGPCSHLI